MFASFLSDIPQVFSTDYSHDEMRIGVSDGHLTANKIIDSLHELPTYWSVWPAAYTHGQCSGKPEDKGFPARQIPCTEVFPRLVNAILTTNATAQGNFKIPRLPVS